MPIEQVVAGAYTKTYDAVDVGATENGFEILMDSHAEILNNFDPYGDTVIDMVYRGGSCRLMYEAKVYKSGSITPFWPWGAGTLGLLWSTGSPIGRLASDVAAASVLTAVANTPADGNPATLSAPLSILTPNANLRLLFSTKARTVPIQLQLLPSETAGQGTVFSTT